MDISEKVDLLTQTFSADRSFCNYLFTSESAKVVSEILVYYKWARLYLPHLQEGLGRMALKHFPSEHGKDAQFWTTILTGSILKDICLIPYLVLRGIIPEAGFVLRRGMEAAGVLPHLWHEPSKVSVMSNTESKEFRSAFIFEADKKIRKQLEQSGIKKRFSRFSLFAKPASDLYEILSKWNVHGDTPSNMSLTSCQPTQLSCGFTNRYESVHQGHLDVLSHGCEILCAEVAMVCEEYGKKYGVTSAEAIEGGRLLSNLLRSPSGTSTEMDRQVREVLTEVGCG